MGAGRQPGAGKPGGAVGARRAGRCAAAGDRDSARGRAGALPRGGPPPPAAVGLPGAHASVQPPHHFLWACAISGISHSCQLLTHQDWCQVVRAAAVGVLNRRVHRSGNVCLSPPRLAPLVVTRSPLHAQGSFRHDAICTWGCGHARTAFCAGLRHVSAARLSVDYKNEMMSQMVMAHLRADTDAFNAQMQHNADLEAENAELRAELAAVATAREAAEAALWRESTQRAVAAEAAVMQQAWHMQHFEYSHPCASETHRMIDAFMPEQLHNPDRSSSVQFQDISCLDGMCTLFAWTWIKRSNGGAFQIWVAKFRCLVAGIGRGRGRALQGDRSAPTWAGRPCCTGGRRIWGMLSCVLPNAALP